MNIILNRKDQILMILLVMTLACLGYGYKPSHKERQMCDQKKCLNKNKTEAPEPYRDPPNQLEAEVLRHIFKTVLESGRAPTIREMEVFFKLSENDVIATLDELESKDLLFRKKGTQELISLYPFSMIPTKHKIFLEDGRSLYAMCAVDALGMPVMFNRNVKIVSQCEWCKQEIVIEIKKGEIVSKSHKDTMIWKAGRPESAPSAETCCPKINFFCSKKHIEEWKAWNPDLAKAGFSLPLERAFPDIKKRWGAYGEILGIR